MSSPQTENKKTKKKITDLRSESHEATHSAKLSLLGNWESALKYIRER